MDQLPLQSSTQLLDSWEPLFKFTVRETKFLEKEIRREQAEKMPPPAPKKLRPAPKIVINLKDLTLHRRNRLKFELSTQYKIPPNLLDDNIAILENPKYRIVLERRQQQFDYLSSKFVYPPVNVSTSELARLFVRERMRAAGYVVPDNLSKEEAKAYVEGRLQPVRALLEPTALVKSFE
jgi:hypothetical protein